MEQFQDAMRCVDNVIEKIGNTIVLGLPLGLGKPNQLVNAFYQKAKSNPEISLRIITALSLEKPQPKDVMEAKFLVPFVERVFGDYESLEYMQAMRANTLPDNITVSEFYFKAGAMKHVASAQQHYISTNYTFVCRDLLDNGVNVLAQMVAAEQFDGEDWFSLSCNTDVTLDLWPLLDQAREDGRPVVTIAQVHDDLPFMYNHAMIEPDCFDLVLRNPQYNTRLFAPPNMAVPLQDYFAGLYASALIRDGGTLQIGIGSLGDAIVYASQLRHQENGTYQQILAQCDIDPALLAKVGGDDTFEKGLYGSSEMFVNGFMHLIQSGIVKRKVYDDVQLQQLINQGLIEEKVSPNTLTVLMNAGVIDSQLTFQDVTYLQHWGIFSEQVVWDNDTIRVDTRRFTLYLTNDHNFAEICEYCLGETLQRGVYMHGGFFLGPEDFYQQLRDMPREQSENICMSSVGHINQLDFDPELLHAQRQDARFINTGMMVTLSGAVVSDGLEDGTVISGVGGQYDFVAMAHKLSGARSILCVRSTRGEGKQRQSNIVTQYGHTTIPRHLRDMVVTEYGIADLRGKTDEQVIIALIAVADSAFQQELVEDAKAQGKLSSQYEIPNEYRNNTPSRLAEQLNQWQQQGYFPNFPLGSDFTEEEVALGKSLRKIKATMEEPKSMIKAVLRSFINSSDEAQAAPYLQRIGLEHPETAKEVLLQHLLLLELEDNGYLKSL
ncbi:hypothetical protein A9Q99_05925 [Gammaproteobacteria bacterium 45_16_T64]|nr:hypothetical protein A9Q99_05925 [Gammaproteobacteria bacterium 45_16_T64]